MQQESEDVSALPITGAGSALGDLQAIARNSGDQALQSAVRRVAWQVAHISDRLTAAERIAQTTSSRLSVIVGQRDELAETVRRNGLSANDALQARIERQQSEVKRALAQAKAAIAEWDEARRNREALRVENPKLRSDNGALNSAKPGAPGEPPKAPKKPPIPDYIAAIPAPEPSAEEAALLDERAKIVAEVDRLTAVGKSKRTPDQHVQMLALQARLAEFAPKVKAFKMARHAERMRREAEAMAAEAMKAAGLTA